MRIVDKSRSHCVVNSACFIIKHHRLFYAPNVLFVKSAVITELFCMVPPEGFGISGLTSSRDMLQFNKLDQNDFVMLH